MWFVFLIIVEDVFRDEYIVNFDNFDVVFYDELMDVLVVFFFLFYQEVKMFVEEMFVFFGGDQVMKSYFEQNFRYFEIVKEFGIEGKVYVKFIVWEDGLIMDVRVLWGDFLLISEVLCFIENMFDWIFGKEKGKVVVIYFILLVDFQLK